VLAVGLECDVLAGSSVALAEGWPVLPGESLTAGAEAARPVSVDTLPPQPINVVDTVTLIAADTAARKTFASMAAPLKA
jgi:hypothetical protein